VAKEHPSYMSVVVSIESVLMADRTVLEKEDVAVVEFESHETMAAWRAHPEHREAQRLGRERWFTEYRITVCDTVRDYSFKA